MVFESLVVELVNRFLGDFIENLDKSQLSISLWGGDVVLNNLFVRENILDEHDLPFKCLFGNIGQLTLKIPWKNLYTQPTIALLDGLYIIAVPNSSIAYDAAKEEKAAWDTKQKDLAKIEEAKKREAEKDLEKDPKQDSFAEKLVSNVIKNLEVKITNIHVRYEDSYTDPLKPFSLGVTLRELSCQTTDEKWAVTVVKEATSLFYKMVKLDSLSLYWNVSPTKYIGKERVGIQDTLKLNIVDEAKKTDYQYMIEPLTSNACVRMNMKPESSNFSLPKILIDVLFQEISIALRKTQYQVLMEFLESFERMQLANKFRKYRPDIPHKGNYKKWWQFAYQCVLKETVRRRRKMWSWKNMKAHRDLCREYRGLYKTKLLTSKPSADLLAKLEKCERELDVLNITMMRQQADVEAKKEAEKNKGSGGWLGWFGLSSKPSAADEKSTKDKFQELMTPEEKQKLYDAIGYQDNVDTVFPKEYVGMKLMVKLKNLGLKLIDTDSGQNEVLHLQLQDVGADVSQRPGANAIKLTTSMQSMKVTGLADEGKTVLPEIVSSLVNEQGPFFEVFFETNPLNGACDTKIAVTARPLEVAYDGKTIILLADFFKPPADVHCVQLQAAALAKFEEVKKNTASGLKFALEQHKFTDISVCLYPTHVIVPEGGVIKPNCRMLILDLGKLSIKTEKPALRSSTGPSAGGDSAPTPPKLSLDEMKKQAYDRFQLSLETFELLFASAGDDWMKARGKVTDMHIIRPMSMNIDIYKSIMVDVELPKIRVVGNLPDLNIHLSDQKLIDMLSLVQNLPLPKGAPPAAEHEGDISLKAPDLKYLPIKEEPENLIARFQPGEGDSPATDSSQGKDSQKAVPFYNETDMELKFEIEEICVTVSQRKNDVDVPTVKVVIKSLGTELKMCTYDMNVTAYLGGVYLQHTRFKALNDGPLVNIINTPIIDEHAFKLLTVRILMAQQTHPTFATTYENTLQKIDVDFTALELLLHQECILDLMEFGQSLQSRMPKPKESGSSLGRGISTASLSSVVSSTTRTSEARKSRKKKDTAEVIDLALHACLDVISIGICNQERVLTDIKIKGLDSRITLQKSQTCVKASLKDITVSDHMPETFYPKILSFEGGQVFDADVVVFNNATRGSRYLDKQNVDTKFALNTGCMKIVFLNRFVQDVLNFMNHFQAAKDSISEAGSAVKDKAASAAQELSQKQPRISLDIKLAAPIVIIPKSSKSNDALVVNLGKLNVSNSFQMLGKKDSKGLPAVLDGMVIELTDLRICRALVMETEMRAECLILEPVTLRLQVIRNLSSAWYHDNPDVEIIAVLQSFSILMSQGDLGTTLGILTDNLQEGAQVAVTPPAPQPSPSKDTTVPSPPTTDRNTLTVPGSTLKPVPAVQPVSEVYSNLKAGLTVESIKLELFTGDSDLSVGLSQRAVDHSLAKLELTEIQVAADMKSDKSMLANVALLAIQLFDSRPLKQNGITHTISPTRTGAGMAEAAKMIEILFKQDSKLNKDIDMKVNSLYVVVNLEFLLKVSDFFVKGLPKTVPASSPPQIQDSSNAPSSSPVAPPSTPPAEASDAELKLTFKLNNPEIILVENAANMDTNALFLGLDVNFLLRNSSDLQTMKGSLSGLSIESSRFSAAPDEQKTTILSPVDIQLQSSAPYGRNHHMEVAMSDIFLTISSDSIRILTAAMASLSVPQNEGEADELHKIPKDLWAIKKIEDCEFWFLKSDDDISGAEAIKKDLAAIGSGAEVKRDEQLILSQSRITLTLLCGVDRRTIPLIITQLMLKDVDVRNWSSKLDVNCELTLEVTYNNEKLSVWESLVEPVEAEDRHRPWELTVKVNSNELLDPVDETDNESPVLALPKMTVNIISHDVMQVTISKTSLDVFKSLGQSFSDAYHLVAIPAAEQEDVAPYFIKNQSGMTITIKVGDTFTGKPGAEIQPGSSDGSLVLEAGQNVELFNKVDATKKPLTGMDGLFNSIVDDQNKRILLTIEDCAETRELRLTRAEQRAFAIQQRACPGEPWQLVTQIETFFGCKTITLRSNVQVRNCLPLPLEIYYKLSDDASARCGLVEPGAICSLPCDAAYMPTHEISFRPSQGGYMESNVGCKWTNLTLPEGDNGLQLFECKSTKPELPPVYVSAKVEIENIFYESTTEATAKSYLITLNPTVVFRNLLPLPVLCSFQGSESKVEVASGDKMQLISVKPGVTGTSITISFRYQLKDWTACHPVDTKPETLSIWSFESQENGQKVPLDLGVHTDNSGGFLQLSLYSPYWMINKTERNLSYKASDDCVVKHDANFSDAMFFLFKKNVSAGSKKVALRLQDSDWSDKFSLDTVGSMGTVTCKTKSEAQPKSSKESSKRLAVGVKITLASTGLTKIITFLPFYSIINQANFTIRFKEHGPNAEWLEVEPGACVPFWPSHSDSSKQLVASIKGTELETKAFDITDSQITMLQLHHNYGGINVEVQAVEGAITIIFQQYLTGYASVLLINDTLSHSFDYHQKDLKEQGQSLGPKLSVLYTWQDPIMKRELLWTCGEKKDKNELIKDGFGEFFADSNSKLYWVSFLDGMQRVFLLTDDIAVVMRGQQAGELERIDMELNLCLQGFGLSLVNNLQCREIAYLGITSSGIIWEQKKRKRYKALKTKISRALEEGFQTYEMEVEAKKATPGRKTLEEKVEVDFTMRPMQMFKPEKGPIKRSFQHGIWLQYRTSTHQTQIHLKVHRLQLDNQSVSAVFTTVVAPTPPPKSVAADSVPKPFAELSVMIRKSSHSNVKQFKYCKLLVQEMAVKVDQGFIGSMLALFAPLEDDDMERLVAFKQDSELIDKPLMDSAVQLSTSDLKNFYDMMHFSPLKIHLSFSLYGADEAQIGDKTFQFSVLSLFLQSIGVVLTDIQDIVFKLGYFERNYMFYSQSQLTSEITRHYTQQALKQMYVLVLGLDVLGNPFGVIRGLATGIEDLFYEPYQGAIQGPEEFAEGLALGVRSLLGNVVGGVSGAVSRITGTLGKTLATLSLDDEYQKKRREELNRPPADLKEGLARGGKGLVMGVFDGVTGIVTRPMEGAKQEGVGGFFKGLGKGLIGVVTRPVGGVVDLASSSFEGIRRVADMSDEVYRLRPARFIQADGILRPYVFREAEGNQILKDADKGIYANDSYLGHVYVSADQPNIFLGTDKRIMFLSKGDLLGQWNSEWCYTWNLLREAPTISQKGIQVLLKEKEKKWFASSSIGKNVIVLERDKKYAEAFIGRLKGAMTASIPLKS